MRISILKESLCIGGTERSAANISLALSENHDVTTVLFDGSNISYPYGGALCDMQLPPKPGKISKVFNGIFRSLNYKKHIKIFQPDIVFQFLSVASPVGLLKIKECVKIVSCRDFSALANRHKLFKKRLDASDAMICNSDYLRDYYVKIYPEDKNRVFAVHNIIDSDFINKQSEEETDCAFLDFRDNHSKLVVSAGRFCREKAFENLIEAFALVHDVMPGIGLVLIGDGNYKELYLNRIEEFGISDSVYFTGYQTNPYKYMKKCDLFVLSSLSEGFPNVLAEAMALSLPVISVNCLTGPAEILMKEYDYKIADEKFVECEYGILTPHYGIKGTEYAVKEISNAIIHMLSDELLMKKYGDLSLERAADFSASSSVKKLENIFDALVFDKRGCRG